VVSSKKLSIGRSGRLDFDFIVSIIHWKKKGALHNPNIMTTALNNPSCVTIPNNSLAYSETGTFIKPDFWSILQNIVAPYNLSITDLQAGI
jgi:hypothetical protein